MHVKLVFLVDIVQEKLGDNQQQFYIAAAAMFVYLAMSHMTVCVFVCVSLSTV